MNWVIAEHKSQGIFQMEYSRRTQEHFWLFEISGTGAVRSRNFLQKVEDRPQARVVREEEFAKALSA